jgi:hypothetical protein
VRRSVSDSPPFCWSSRQLESAQGSNRPNQRIERVDSLKVDCLVTKTNVSHVKETLKLHRVLEWELGTHLLVRIISPPLDLNAGGLVAHAQANAGPVFSPSRQGSAIPYASLATIFNGPRMKWLAEIQTLLASSSGLVAEGHAAGATSGVAFEVFA